MKERVYIIGLARDPYCDLCEASVFGETQDYFKQCGQVNTLWRWVRTVLYLIMGAQANLITGKELLNISWASSRFDREAGWLIVGLSGLDGENSRVTYQTLSMEGSCLAS